ncbi:MAG: hypothetical protein WC647_13220 [Desulfomonilaceae bacterium]
MPAILSPVEFVQNPLSATGRPTLEPLRFTPPMSFRPLGEIQPGGLYAETRNAVPSSALVRSLVAALARDDVGVFLRRAGRARDSFAHLIRTTPTVGHGPTYA